MPAWAPSIASALPKTGRSVSSENKSAGGLKTRALATGAWSLAATGSVYALRLGSNLIMTRLLMPEAFGLIALVGVIVSGLEMFTDVGIKRSVIRENDGDTTHFLRVAWTVKILRASVIAGVVLIIALGLALAAPLFPEASTYAQPELPGLLAMAALSPILIGATSTASELLQRQMQMKLLVIYGILSRVLSIIGMVIFAWIWPSVWALLAGMLLANLFSFLSSHLLLPGPRMALSWDPEIGDRLWKFGRWIMASSILTFFSNNADRLILAALLPASTFGIYAISQTWMSAGTSLLQRLNDQVGFPAVAEGWFPPTSRSARLHKCRKWMRVARLPGSGGRRYSRKKSEWKMP
ncbi:MAG: oligosaccharide flippase family protein [Pseudomonadota bacterium]